MLEVREITPGLLHVVGSVDLASVAGMREKFLEAVERAIADEMPILSVDLSAVVFMDVAGLGVLLGAHRRARRGGSSLRLVRINADLLGLLHTSRLYRVLDIAPDAARDDTAAGSSAPTGAVPGAREGHGAPAESR